MRLSLLLIALVLSINSFGQESLNTAPSSYPKKIQLGVNFSPDYCFRSLRDNNKADRNNEIIDFQNSIEIPKLGFTTGLNLTIPLPKKLGLSIGLNYSNKGYKTIPRNSFTGSIDPRKGFIYDTTEVATIFYYNFNYLDIPVSVNYTFGDGKIRYCARAGVSTNILLKANTVTVKEHSDGSQTKRKYTEPAYYNTLNISPFVSAGIDWKVNAKSNLCIEPTFRYGLLKIKDSPVTAYLWNVGLNLSYYITL